jgi:hypothetical protein
MTQFHLIRVALTAGLIAAAGAAQADVQKFITPCDGKLCPSFQLVLTPPNGWVIDKAASAKLRVQIMVPEGKNFNSAPALMYVQVFSHADKQQSLATFASVSNERWKAHVKDAKVTELPAIERANGKPGYLRFAFENPSKSQQGYEFGAFGIDSDKDGNEFVLDVVMTGTSKAALDKAEKEYIAFLKAC